MFWGANKLTSFDSFYREISNARDFRVKIALRDLRECRPKGAAEQNSRNKNYAGHLSCYLVRRPASIEIIMSGDDVRHLQSRRYFSPLVASRK